MMAVQPKTKPTKAWAGALTVLVGAAAAQWLGVGDTPPPEDLVDAVVALLRAGVLAALTYVGVYLPRNAVVKLPAVLLAMVLVGGLAACAGGGPGQTWYLDTDGDPATPPIAVPKEVRCAAYQLTIDTLLAKDSLSRAEAALLIAEQIAQAGAQCPVAEVPELETLDVPAG